MAKKKRKRSAAPRKRTMAAGPRRKGSRRRRRMSAGFGGKAAGMLNNPIIGGIAGAVVGKLIVNIVGKNTSDEIMKNAAPIVGGILLRKKFPYVAAGMVAGPAVGYLGSKISLLAEDNTASFADGSVFGQPLLLAAGDEPLLLAERGYSLSEGNVYDMIENDDYID